MRDKFKSHLSKISTSSTPELFWSQSNENISDLESSKPKTSFISLAGKYTLLLFIILFLAGLIFFSALNKPQPRNIFFENSEDLDSSHRKLSLDHVLIFDIEDLPLEWAIPRDIKVDNTAEFEIITREDISSWFTLNSERTKFIIKDRPSHYKNVTVILKGFLTNGLPYEQKLLICTRKVKTVLRTITSEFQITQGNYNELPQALLMRDKYLIFGWNDASRIHVKEYSLSGDLIIENSFNIHQEETPAYFKLMKFGDSSVFIFWIKKSNLMNFNYIIYNQDFFLLGAKENFNAQPYSGHLEDNNLQAINLANNKFLIVYETNENELKGIFILSEKSEGISEFSIDKASCHKDISITHLVYSFQVLITWTTCDNAIFGTVLEIGGNKQIPVTELTESLIDFTQVKSYHPLSQEEAYLVRGG